MSKENKLSLKPTAAAKLPRPNTAGLPQLPDHFFNHALFEGVSFGPRRELTLGLKPLIWAGHQGHHDPAVMVRFGGIVNFEEVKALFDANPHKRSELGWLDYDKHHASKPGDLYLHLEFERVTARVVVHCSSLTITEPEPDTEKAA